MLRIYLENDEETFLDSANRVLRVLVPSEGIKLQIYLIYATPKVPRKCLIYNFIKIIFLSGIFFKEQCISKRPNI